MLYFVLSFIKDFLEFSIVQFFEMIFLSFAHFLNHFLKSFNFCIFGFDYILQLFDPFILENPSNWLTILLLLLNFVKFLNLKLLESIDGHV